MTKRQNKQGHCRARFFLTTGLDLVKETASIPQAKGRMTAFSTWATLRLWTAGKRDLLVLAGLVGYFVAFFLCPLPSLPAPEAKPWRRFHLLLWLLFPEEWISLWFGEPAQFAIADRLPPFAVAYVIWLWAFTWGAGAIHFLRLHKIFRPAEYFLFSTVVGLNLLSTFTLLTGLLGWLRCARLFQGVAALSLGLGAFYLAIGYLRRKNWPSLLGLLRLSLFRRDPHLSGGGGFGPARSRTSPATGEHAAPTLIKLGMSLAVAIILLGAVLPPAEFDVREYHLQAPKEFFLAGRIAFLPHNVYANMPLGAEMISLLAMALTQDWWLGALAGKLAQAAFTLLLAAGLFTAAARLGDRSKGWVASWIFLSTPWVIQITALGLVEWVWACYGFFAWYAWALWLREHPAGRTPPTAGMPGNQSLHRSLPSWALILLAGYLAGAAAGCKYPAVVFIALPLWAATCFALFRNMLPLWILRSTALPRVSTVEKPRPDKKQNAESFPAINSPTGPRAQKPLDLTAKGDAPYTREPNRPLSGTALLLLCVLGMILGGGAWYGKNAYLAGNPVYPLFGQYLNGKSRDADLIVRWNNAHRPPGFSAGILAQDLLRVVLRSEWLSPLVWPFVLLGWPRVPPLWRRGIFIYAVWWLGLWWLATHRIDRFWLPVLLYLCLVAGFGFDEKPGFPRIFKYYALVVLGYCQLFFAAVVGAGYPRFFVPLEVLRTDPLRVDAWTLRLNRDPTVSGLLLVGQAAVFDYEVPVLYSTCFDPTWLEVLAKNRSASELANELSRLGISHLLVEWGEIARYRSPGNYGFSSFVTPELFQAWEKAGILERLPQLPGHPAVVYRVCPSPEGSRP